jgi:hypothetical protein
LAAAGREADARLWYRRAAEVDPEGVSGAAERVLELDGVVFEVDDDEESADSGFDSADALAPRAGCDVEEPADDGATLATEAR